jgi:hypothetical protein
MNDDKEINKKFGKKKSGNKFSREKIHAYSEIDIVKADNNANKYKEERQVERQQRRVLAGLDPDENKK